MQSGLEAYRGASNAAKGSAEEAEAVGLIDAVNAFRLSSRTQANDNLAQAIGSREEYERASQRIAELSDLPEGTSEADELALLIADFREWDDVRRGD